MLCLFFVLMKVNQSRPKNSLRFFFTETVVTGNGENRFWKIGAIHNKIKIVQEFKKKRCDGQESKKMCHGNLIRRWKFSRANFSMCFEYHSTKPFSHWLKCDPIIALVSKWVPDTGKKREELGRNRYIMKIWFVFHSKISLFWANAWGEESI